MLRIHQSENAGAAKSYYSKALKHGDYYTKEAEERGIWGGKLAHALRLTGDIEAEQFARLCDNRHPYKNTPLTPRTKDNRTPGYDINFHPPKSLTIMYALGDDQQLELLFQKAVRKTMYRLEQNIKTRVRKGNSYRDRETGNLLWSEFIHYTSRPIDGVPDPHLHAHAFTFNATYDHDEKRLKAAKFDAIKRQAPYFEAYFHSELAKSVMHAGYAIRQADNVAGWEIAGIDDVLIQKFSRRTQEIEARAAKEGITAPKEKSALGARTRANKTTTMTTEQLRQVWHHRLSPKEQDAIEEIKASKAQNALKPLSYDARVLRVVAATDYALKHHFERNSVVHTHDLARTAARQSLGYASVPEIEHALNQKVTIDRDGYATHMGIWREETEIVQRAVNGRDQCMPIHDYAEDITIKGMSKEQNAAVRHVLGSRDQITGIIGRAGVGKTTVMKHTVQSIQNAGYDVTVLTPTNAAKDDLHQEGFTQTQTLASYLSKPKNTLGRQELIWLDEAGLVGNKDMLALMRHAERHGARLLLTGDPNQHGSVARGRPLRLLSQYHRDCLASIQQIRRQKSKNLRNIVQNLSTHHTAQGLKQLHHNGHIIEISDNDARHREIAETYQKLKQGSRKGRQKLADVLIIAPTHKDGHALTQKVREVLRRDGEIKGNDTPVNRLVSRGLSETQRQDNHAYTYGDILEFHQNAKGGHRRGDRLVVTEKHDDGRVMVKDMRRGKQIALPLHAADHFDVFQAEAMPLAQGDKIVALRNGQAVNGKRIDSGRAYKVRQVNNEGHIQLENGWVVDPDQYGHFNHGYVLTSHKSQGKTVDHVLISASQESGRAVNPEQAYVSVSRARHSAMIFTDDATHHIKQAEKLKQRRHAMDLIRGTQRRNQQFGEMVGLTKQSQSEQILQGYETSKPHPLPAQQRKKNRGPSYGF